MVHRKPYIPTDKRSYTGVLPAQRLNAGWLHLTEDDTYLLGLAARGLSEAEIGAVVYLSPHTVHHRLERLRYMTGTRNRIELAVWTVLNGFYTPQEGDFESSATASLAGSVLRGGTET